MRILVVGTGGVGGAFAAVAARRDFFDGITLADLDPARPHALVEQLRRAERADAVLLADYGEPHGMVEGDPRVVAPA